MKVYIASDFHLKFVENDEDKKRVIYQPVSIETRVNTPRIIRDDNRYADRTTEEDNSNA